MRYSAHPRDTGNPSLRTGYFGKACSGAETVRILLGLVLLGSFIHSMIDYALSLLIWRPVSGTMRTSRVS